MTLKWIADGEKYAVVGLNIKLEDEFPLEQMSNRLWAFADSSFHMPAHWREWLGTIRADAVEASNVFLLSKMASRTPDILDGESQRLMRNVADFYVGLLLSSKFAPGEKPVSLTGCCRGDEIDVRQQNDWETPIPCLISHYPTVSLSQIRQAANLATNIQMINATKFDEGRWRFNRTLSIYTEARSIRDNLDRLHQYCRCIEGMILPDVGTTKRQFKSKTELFIGPRHHPLIDEMYEIRSAVEHLHEDKYLRVFDRETRLTILRFESIAEYITRSIILRVISTPTLWPYFMNTSALAAFWSKSAADRQAIWGAHIDPKDALAEYDPRYISDAELGYEPAT